MAAVPALLALLFLLSSEPVVSNPPGHSPDHQPARDGDEAVRWEFEAAQREDTPEALEKVIARHPDHPLAEEARRRLAELRSGG